MPIGFISSSTTVQKCYKEECNTLFGRATMNGASAPTLIVNTTATQTVVGGTQTINQLGVSKGIVSISRTGTGLYSIVIDPVICVNQFLGAHNFSLIEGSPAANEIYSIRVVSETLSNTATGVGATLAIVAYTDAGVIADIASGFTLCWSINVSTSGVY